jgi:CheY-like chemotaxis protein
MLAGRRVFVVEDEALVMMLLEDGLMEMGCEIAASASRIEDALEKASSHAFDVAILDVNLNGQKTFPIAATLHRRGIPFIFSTGYGASVLPEPLRTAPVLQKPFQQDDLEQALGTALGVR